MHCLPSGSSAIHSWREDVRPPFCVGAEIPLGGQNAHQSQNGGRSHGAENIAIWFEGGNYEENPSPSPSLRGRGIRSKPQSLAEIEAEYVAATLAATNGNKAEAARVLGISRKNLYERLARLKK